MNLVSLIWLITCYNSYNIVLASQGTQLDSASFNMGEGTCLELVPTPIKMTKGNTVAFEHQPFFERLLNSNCVITVVTSPTKDNRPLSHVPLWFGCNPTRPGHIGLSIGHRRSHDRLELRFGDGNIIEHVQFMHPPVALHKSTERRIEIFHLTPPAGQGRRVDFYLDNQFLASETFPNLTGNTIYQYQELDTQETAPMTRKQKHGRIACNGGALFGDVWDWQFEGTLSSIKLKTLPQEIPSVPTIQDLSITEKINNQQKSTNNGREESNEIKSKGDMPKENKQREKHHRQSRKPRKDYQRQTLSVKDIETKERVKKTKRTFVDKNNVTTTWLNDNLVQRPEWGQRIHLCGLQRTGTNLLAHMLNERKLSNKGLWYKPRTNPSTIRETPPWKHFHIHENEYSVADSGEVRQYKINSVQDFDNLLDLDHNVLYLVAIKNPFAWFVSVCKFWSQGSMFPWQNQGDCTSMLNRKKNKPHSQQRLSRRTKAKSILKQISFVQEHITLYNQYYRHWVKLKQEAPNRIQFIKYEDLLKDCQDVLQRTRIAANLSTDLMPDKSCETRLASPSYGSSRITRGRKKNDTSLWQSKKEFYMQQKYLQELYPEDILEISQMIDSTLLEWFNYSSPQV